ncbi:MAG: hypothetical protein C0467_13990 [Planctomycetaceae bacterium]|nr:hypothetical protein [Planctomycetaceae bacterium]
MNTLTFKPQPLNQLQSSELVVTDEWLWDGYLARGNITLLTSEWKSGKSTLLTGIVRAFEDGSAFLGRPCVASSSLIVSEESAALWAERTRLIPTGGRASLVSRPFVCRPTPEQWDELVRQAEELRAAGNLDVFVVDPLASFLPGRSDSDPGTLLDMLQPLRRLASAGVGVLVLHHPRKKASEEGNAARGSGALLGYVDVILELQRYGKLASDVNRRRLVGLSRRLRTPRSLVYEWVVGTPEFRVVTDPAEARFRENWATVRSILESRQQASTHKELLADWPVDRVPPSSSLLYEWMARAAKQGLVERLGNGTSNDPFRFQLPGKDDDFFKPLGRLDPLPGMRGKR